MGLAALAAAFVTSLSDWFFFGVLFHEDYKAFPEVWRRPEGGAGEGRAVALSGAVSVLSPVLFVGLCAALDVVEPMEVTLLALTVWAIGPLPMLVSTFLFMKMHPRILVAHTAGWLVKLLFCAAAVALLVR